MDKIKLLENYLDEVHQKNADETIKKFFELVEDDFEEIERKDDDGEMFQWSIFLQLKKHHEYVAMLKEEGYSYQVFSYKDSPEKFKKANILRGDLETLNDSYVVIFSKQGFHDMVMIFLIKTENKLTDILKRDAIVVFD